MIYSLLADAVALAHLAFIVFVVVGGFAVLRYPRLAWVHVPVFLWGALISFYNWTCPLTPLEKHLRQKAGEGGYDGGFIDHYILPVIYPETALGEFPRAGFIAAGIFVLAINGAIYWRLWRKRRNARSRA